MGLLRCLLGSVIGGAVGALIWALIARYAHVEIGWIAWGVGGLVGFGSACFSGGHQDDAAGAIAALVAVVAVAGGRYWAISWMIDDTVSTSKLNSFHVDDDMAVRHLAKDLTGEYQQAGKPLKWPEGKSAEDAKNKEDYPKDLWADAQARYKRMTPEQQEDYKTALQNHVVGMVQAFKGEAAQADFMDSFTFIDILFGFFAVSTAFAVASGRTGGRD